MSYEKYASRAPPGKLEQVLDDENQSDIHLNKIAGELDEQKMANDLCPQLGLTKREISDIQRACTTDPPRMRIEFLSKWKQKEGLDATYDNLVRKLLAIGDKAGALVVVELWGRPKPAGSQPVASQQPPVQQSAAHGKEIELSMRHLGLIKYPGGRFCLRDKVSNKWREIGTNLNIEPNKLDGYDSETQGSSIECWAKVMQSWLDGQGTEEYPKGWSGLYEMLNDVGVSQIADELRSAVEKASNK